MTNQDQDNQNDNRNDCDNGDYDDDDNITESEHLRKLFIGGLDYSTTDESLKSYFEKWGKVVDVVVMKDPKTKRSRGFGFITYSRSSMVDEAQSNRPHKIDGRVVEPKRAVPRQEIDRPEAGASTKRLFVGGLRDEHEEEDLKEYFSQFGSIVSVTLITEKGTEKKRGFGFVEFDDYDPVDKVVLQKNHKIKDKALDVKKALPKQDMDRGGQGGGGGRGGGGRGDRDGGRGGGGRGRNDDWGNGGGNWNRGGGGGGGGGSWNNGGGFNNGGGGGAFNNGGGSGGGGNWGNMGGNTWGSGGGGAGSNGGGSWGGNSGGGNGNWSGSNNGGGGGGNFGGGYQGGYGGGPVRSGNFNNRVAPYGNNSGGGGGGGSGGGGGGYGGGGNFNRRF